MNLSPAIDKTSAVYQQSLVKSARGTLLAATLFTVLNMVLLLVGSGYYFLYSATIPYYLTFFGYMFDHFMVGTYTCTGLIMAVVPVIGLALCWFMSKKNSRWLTGAAVIFGLDTAAMVAMLIWAGDMSSSVLDILFHAWVMFCLVRGVLAANRLKKTLAPAPIMWGETEEVYEEATAEEVPEEFAAEESLPQ